MSFLNRAPPGGALAGIEQFAAVATIFDAAEIVVYVADMHTYELLFVNKHAERLWGAMLGELCYKVLQAGQSRPCEFCTNPRLTENGRAVHPVVWEFQNTVNKRWFLCIDKAIPWVDGRLVRMEVAIDITEQKAHEQFREHYIELVSHDLRNPLTTISTAADLLRLLLEPAAPAGSMEALQAIERNAGRMAEMIDDLLETTRLESGQIRLHTSSFDLARLAATVVDQMRAGASHPVRLESSGSARVLADPGRIERVLENLVGNAQRYSPPGSLVSVRIEANDAEAVVAVADRGSGIAAEELPNLFQRFYRGSKHPSGKGLGLGLYNSRLIIERHGGRIWAESTPGAGSTFRFALPVAPRA